MQTQIKKGPSSSRSETIAVRLDPKVRWLVELAAREQMRTLSSFVEITIHKALTDGFGRNLSQEPKVGTEFVYPPAPKPMWGEGLWDVDQADRFFLLATNRYDLMTLDEQRLWKLLSGSILLQDKKLTRENFRLAFNDALVDKTHLERGTEQ